MNPFDEKAATWDENPVRRQRTAELAAEIARRVALHPGMRVLEYGCGTAALSALLADRVGTIVAADSSPGMIEQVGRKLAATGIRNVEPRLLDLERHPAPAGTFDLVVSAMALHHVIDPTAVLRALAGLLAPGGTLLLADLVTEDGSFHTDMQVPHHGFDPDSLLTVLVRAGLANGGWSTVFRMMRGERAYPVFLLSASRPARTRVLFLCTGNSCRSQMAEGWARALKSDVIEAHSAGITTHGLNPLAVRVMAEAGVDISGHCSKNTDAVRNIAFDYVVTVCGHANETCPAWLGGKARVVHVGFDDPPALARTAKTEDEALAHYRRVRDEIRAFVERLPGALRA